VIPLSDIEKRYILEVLQKCGGNRTHAARKLGISIRTLRNRLAEYGLAPKDEEEAEAPAD
jgi:DNA-binding NtrC family response regulator